MWQIFLCPVERWTPNNSPSDNSDLQANFRLIGFSIERYCHLITNLLLSVTMNQFHNEASKFCPIHSVHIVTCTIHLATFDLGKQTRATGKRSDHNRCLQIISNSNRFYGSSYEQYPRKFPCINIIHWREQLGTLRHRNTYAHESASENYRLSRYELTWGYQDRTDLRWLVGYSFIHSLIYWKHRWGKSMWFDDKEKVSIPFLNKMHKNR